MNPQKPHRFLWLAVAGIALQALVPAGYMPAPLTGGLPFVLCPGGLFGAPFFIANEGHAQRNGHHEPAHEHAAGGESSPVREFCPFGAVFGGTALITEYDAPSPPLEYTPPATDAGGITRSLPGQSWRARAPPTDQPIDA